jgi:hypothetical protein
VKKNVLLFLKTKQLIKEEDKSVLRIVVWFYFFYERIVVWFLWEIIYLILFRFLWPIFLRIKVSSGGWGSNLVHFFLSILILEFLVTRLSLDYLTKKNQR